MQRIPDLTFTRSSETEETLAHGRADGDATGMKKISELMTWLTFTERKQLLLPLFAIFT